MDNKEILKQIGLTDNEAEVYLILLNSKEALASDIAKKTRISRPHVYDILNKLVERGLVSYIVKNNKKYFKPINPEKLVDYLKEKEILLESIIPNLNELYQPLKNKPQIRVLEGSEGLKTILNDILKNAREILVFGASDRVRNYLPEYFVNRYLKEREKKNIIAKQLYSEGTGLLKSKVSIFKRLPKEFASPSTTLIYANKVIIWIWSETPITLEIESEEVVKSYKNHFELMWRAVKN
ncbi:MAG: helix-turn-helix domain-containing protein [Nanoarchaeota archaeon]